jgi:hypothetical protein
MTGRPQLGLIATAVPGLNLRVAVLLHDLQLAAGLAKSVLSVAVQELIDRARPSDADDWLTVVRAARACRASMSKLRGCGGGGRSARAGHGTTVPTVASRLDRRRGARACSSRDRRRRDGRQSDRRVRTPATPVVRIVAPAEGALITGAAAAHRGSARARHQRDLLRRWSAGVQSHQAAIRLRLGRRTADRRASGAVVVNLASGNRVVQTARTQGMAFAETVDVDIVQVTVTVTDDRGRYVKDLPQSAFHVSENGRPQPTSQFYSQDVPLELVVAVDTSWSMVSAMPKVKKAASQFMGAVPSRDHVTLLGFSGEVFTLTRKTTDPAERMKAVDGLVAWADGAV